MQEHQSQTAQPTGSQSGVVMMAAATGAMLLIGAFALWAHYGTAVFFETIAAGIAACF